MTFTPEEIRIRRLEATRRWRARNKAHIRRYNKRMREKYYPVLRVRRRELGRAGGYRQDYLARIAKNPNYWRGRDMARFSREYRARRRLRDALSKFASVCAMNRTYLPEHTHG